MCFLFFDNAILFCILHNFRGVIKSCGQGTIKKAYPSVNIIKICNRIGGYAYGEAYRRLFSVTAEEEGVWPKDLILGMMLDFSISTEIKKKAHKFKVMYSVNGVETSLGEGAFKFPPDELDQDGDYQMTIFAKSQYHFESCGKLSHCVKIFDASENEIAQASPMTELLIKENIVPS